MVEPEHVCAALRDLSEQELQRLCRLGDRLLVIHPLDRSGQGRDRRRAGAGDDFLEHRGYRPGDDLRRIDWRSSLRCQRLQLRCYHDQEDSCITILLDRSASMGSDATKWLQAVRMAAALSYLWLQRGGRVGLIAFSGSIDYHCVPARGRRQYRTIVAALSCMTPRNGGGATELSNCLPLLARQSAAILVSDCLRPDAMIPAIDRLRAKRIAIGIIQLLSPFDASAEPTARQVEDIETGQRKEIAPGDDGLASAALTRHARRLRQACAQRGIPYTGEPLAAPWQTLCYRHLCEICRYHA